MPQHRVILDTDIGDNIDDAFALALLLRCRAEAPRFEVKTCFGDVLRRARTAYRMMRLELGRDWIGESGHWLSTGASRPIASRPIAVDLRRCYTYGDARGKFWCYPGQIGNYLTRRLLTGPMTDAAISLALGPAGDIEPHYVAMAGDFREGWAVEHNVRCDPEAAHLVFSSGLSIDVIPYGMGRGTALNDTDLARLRTASGERNKLAILLLAWLEQFWQHYPGKTDMHDPMAVVALLHPEWFDWRRGRVSVELRDEARYGQTRFEEDPAGPHRVAFDVEPARAKNFMLDRICGPPG